MLLLKSLLPDLKPNNISLYHHTMTEDHCAVNLEVHKAGLILRSESAICHWH